MSAPNHKVIAAADSEIVPYIPANNFKIIPCKNTKEKKFVDLFFALTTSSLLEHAGAIRQALAVKQFKLLFLREDIAIDWLPGLLMAAKLPIHQLLPKLFIYSDWQVLKRVINAWADDSEHILIANAVAKDNMLLVRNCALETIELAFEKTPVLQDIPAKWRTCFEIVDNGSFIHWPNLDIDLDFEALHYLSDPKFKEKQDAKKLMAEKNFGKAIAAVRKKSHLSQATVETKVGLSERQLRRYEKEGFKPRVSTLRKLAQAHDLNLNDYLNSLSKAIVHLAGTKHAV